MSARSIKNVLLVTTLLFAYPSYSFAGDSTSVMPVNPGSSQSKSYYAAFLYDQSIGDYVPSSELNVWSSVQTREMFDMNSGEFRMSDQLTVGAADVAAHADELRQDGVYLEASQLSVARAKNADDAGFATKSGSSATSTTASGLSSDASVDGSKITGTIDGSKISGAVAKAKSADASEQANKIWNPGTNTYTWAHEVKVNGAGTADNANSVWNDATKSYTWAQSVKVNSAAYSDSSGSAGQANKIWNPGTNTYTWAHEVKANNAASADSAGSAGSLNGLKNIFIHYCRSHGSDFSTAPGLRKEWSNGTETFECPGGMYPN